MIVIVTIIVISYSHCANGRNNLTENRNGGGGGDDVCVFNGSSGDGGGGLSPRPSGPAHGFRGREC